MVDGNRKSKEALGQFLDYLGSKGLMQKNTVVGRKAAMKVLDVLEPDEAEDVTSIDVDDVVRRFGHLHGKGYNPKSLAAYRSRLRATLGDFRAYLDNPLSFRPSVRKRVGVTREKTDKEPTPSLASRPEGPRIAPAFVPEANIVPIPIRADLVIRIQGLPYDLTKAEADKIAAVVQAMAS